LFLATKGFLKALFLPGRSLVYAFEVQKTGTQYFAIGRFKIESSCLPK